MARGRGQDFDLATLRDAINQRGYRRDQETPKITAREVLGWELEVVVAAHDGRNRHGALSAGFQTLPSLSAEQKRAVERILGSRDSITLLRGGAGTGKSFTLQEIERGLRAANRPVVVLAPQRQQVGDLRAAGLPAETLALFLEKRDLPRGAVVVVDEAGQIGAKQSGETKRIAADSA